MITFANILRGGAVVARRAHNPKVRGSSPLPATRTKDDFFRSSFLFTITLTGFRTLSGFFYQWEEWHSGNFDTKQGSVLCR